jgi:hypothetical protein
VALTLTVRTVANVTTVIGTVSGGAGGTATATIFSEPGGVGIGRGGMVERFRIKVVRLVGAATVAHDYLSLRDLGTTPGGTSSLAAAPAADAVKGFVPDSAGTSNLVWDSTMGGNPFNDQTNLGDEFRNGLQVSAQTAATTNDPFAGYVFALFLYHGLS